MARTGQDLTRRGFLGLSAGVGAAALLTACGDDDGQVAAGPSGAAGEPVIVRTCVYAKNHASAPLFWQQFAPKGWKVEVTPVTSATQIQDALESGELDFGLLGPYSTLIAASTGKITSKIVGMTARQGVGLIGAKGKVESVADLRGKTIGVPPPGIQVLILNDLLTKAGMVLGKDVKGIPVAYADQPAALEKGSIDAYIGTEPLCTQSVVAGTGVRLPEVRTTAVGDFNTANWASAKVLKERPDVVREVVRMQKAAAEFLTPGGQNDRNRWKELLVTQFGYAEPVYEAVLENVGAVWQFDATREAQVRGAGKMLLTQKGITSEPDYDALFAREYWTV
jgi:NitT/TauT family transport system substrate-binding protein